MPSGYTLGNLACTSNEIGSGHCPPGDALGNFACTKSEPHKQSWCAETNKFEGCGLGVEGREAKFAVACNLLFFKKFPTKNKPSLEYRANDAARAAYARAIRGDAFERSEALV